MKVMLQKYLKRLQKYNQERFKRKDMKKIKKNKVVIKDKVLLFLIGILVIMSVAIIAMKIITRNNLDTESKLVTELHNYFSYEDLGNCDGLFTYGEDKVDYNNLNPENRICLAYQKSKIKEVKNETLKANKKKSTCKKDDMIFRADEETNECNVKIIERKSIDDTYKKLYGKEIEDNKSFRIDNLNICYLKDDHYYCGLSETFSYTLGNESIIYRVIKKAVEKGSEIEIYDYFTKINNKTCYKYYTTATVNQNCTDEYKNTKDINYNFMKKYGTEYKHVFKKDKNDNYYWVSSEPVK